MKRCWSEKPNSWASPEWHSAPHASPTAVNQRSEDIWNQKLHFHRIIVRNFHDLGLAFSSTSQNFQYPLARHFTVSGMIFYVRLYLLVIVSPVLVIFTKCLLALIIRNSDNHSVAYMVHIFSELQHLSSSSLILRGKKKKPTRYNKSYFISYYLAPDILCQLFLYLFQYY